MYCVLTDYLFIIIDLLSLVGRMRLCVSVTLCLSVSGPEETLRQSLEGLRDQAVSHSHVSDATKFQTVTCVDLHCSKSWLLLTLLQLTLWSAAFLPSVS